MKPTLRDNYHERIIFAFVTLFFGVSFSPPAAATDIHPEWSNEHIADLFPSPLNGWSIAELSLEERETMTSGFESFVGGLAGTDVGMSMRLLAKRLYFAPDRVITVMVDSSDIETAASIDAIAAAHETDENLREDLAETGVISITHQNHIGFSVREDDRAGVAFKIGSVGAVTMECDYSGCAEDLARMTHRLDLGRLTRFSDFDHRK